MIIRLRPVLERLALKNTICWSSVDSTIAKFGETAIINRKNLERAMNYRGDIHFRNFFAEALGWNKELIRYVDQLAGDMLWGRTDLPWDFRRKISDKICIEAVLAYVKEMNKP